MATYIIGAVVIGAMVFAGYRSYKNFKAGSCSGSCGGCSGCPSAQGGHSTPEK